MRVEKITRRSRKFSRKLVAVLLVGLLFAPLSQVRGQTLLHTVNIAGTDTWFGWSVASLGDVNADGNPDFVVGAPFAGGQGQAFVVRVLPQGTEVRTLNMPGSQAPGNGSAQFGWAVTGMGDVDGDGVSDFAVAAPFQSETPQSTTWPGKVHVFSGADLRLLYSLGSQQAPLSEGAGFGYAIASVPDLDGDGVRELAVGAPVQGANAQGQVFVFSGALNRQGPALVVLDNPGASFGFFGGAGITGVGDVNNDNVGDIAVGAPDQDGQGRVYVFSGQNGGLLRTLSNPSSASSSGFGEALAMIGDVDGDGRSDLAVGAPLQNGSTGQVFIFPGAAPGQAPFSGSALLLNVPPPAADDLPANGATFGRALAAVGDYDGDNVPDVAVGAPNYNVTVPAGVPTSAGLGVGKVFLLSGRTGEVLAKLDNPGARVTGNVNYGQQVVVVENANGGVRYLVNASPFQPDSQTGTVGQVYVYSLPDSEATPPAPPEVPDVEPVVTVPANMFVEATSANGASVTYAATATDTNLVSFACVPASGSNFPLGTTTVTCTAADGGGHVVTRSFQITVRDRTAPQTYIHSVVDGQQKSVGNGGSTVSTGVTIKFGSTDAVGTTGYYYCSWDGAPYAPCTSPLSRANLSTGKHVFGVKARDAWNNVDESPATWTWTVLTKAQAALELKEGVKDLELSRREHAKLTALLREIKQRLSNRKSSDDRRACDELDAFLKKLGNLERTHVVSSAQATPLRDLAESLRSTIGCRTYKNKSWQAGHYYRR